MSARNGCGGCLGQGLLIVGGLYLLLLVLPDMCTDKTGDKYLERMHEHQMQKLRQEWGLEPPRDETRELWKEALWPLREAAWLAAALAGCAFLGGAGRDAAGRWPGRLTGLGVGAAVLPVITIGSWVTQLPFLDALHLGEAAALGLVGLLAAARVLGRGQRDPPDL